MTLRIAAVGVMCLLGCVSCGYSRTAYVPTPDRFQAPEQAVESVRYAMSNNALKLERVEVTKDGFSYLRNGKHHKCRHRDVESAELYTASGLSRVQLSGTDAYTVKLIFQDDWVYLKFSEKGDAVRYMDAVEYLRQGK